MICHHLLYFIKQKFCLVRCWSFSIKSDCKVSTLSSRAFSSSETILSVWTQASCVTSTLSSTSSLGSSSEQSLLALVLMLEIDLLYFEGLWDFLGLLLHGKWTEGTSSSLSKRPPACTKCSLQMQMCLLILRFSLPVLWIHCFNNVFCLREVKQRKDWLL